MCCNIQRLIQLHPFFYSFSASGPHQISRATFSIIDFYTSAKSPTNTSNEQNLEEFATMVKIFTSTYSYDYSFPAVSLAYFLRYPNPYSTHVLSEDVISRHFDPETQRLYTTRLHLKQSKLPSWILKLLPKNILGNSRGANGEAQNYILEKSVVDIAEGWMETETQNLQLTGVLKVIEKQRFSRPGEPLAVDAEHSTPVARAMHSPTSKKDTTDVTTTVTFQSRLGEIMRKGDTTSAEAQESRKGFFSWSTAGLRRTIEEMSLERTQKGLINSKQGMTVVLERLRQGGLAAVLEGMRQDRQMILGAVAGNGTLVQSQSRWKNVWQGGNNDSDDGIDV
jgi:4-amino-4-deoxychorismate lyase